MTITLRPIGRGNWATLTMVLEGDRASPLFIRIGQRIFLGGLTFRICRVQP